MRGRPKGKKIGPYPKLRETPEGQFVEDIRHELQLTFEQLSERTGISVRTLKGIANRKREYRYTEPSYGRNTLSWLKEWAKKNCKDAKLGG